MSSDLYSVTEVYHLTNSFRFHVDVGPHDKTIFFGTFEGDIWRYSLDVQYNNSLFISRLFKIDTAKLCYRWSVFADKFKLNWFHFTSNFTSISPCDRYKIQELLVNTDHRWCNLSSLCLVKIKTFLKITSRQHILHGEKWTLTPLFFICIM